MFTCFSVSAVTCGKAPCGKRSVARWVSADQRAQREAPVMVSVSTAVRDVLLKVKCVSAGRSTPHATAPRPLASVSVFCCMKFSPPSSTVSSAGTTPHLASSAPRASSVSVPSCMAPVPSLMWASLGSLAKSTSACRKHL